MLDAVSKNKFMNSQR